MCRADWKEDTTTKVVKFVIIGGGGYAAGSYLAFMYMATKSSNSYTTRGCNNVGGVGPVKLLRSSMTFMIITVGDGLASNADYALFRLTQD